MFAAPYSKSFMSSSGNRRTDEGSAPKLVIKRMSLETEQVRPSVIVLIFSISNPSSLLALRSIVSNQTSPCGRAVVTI